MKCELLGPPDSSLGVNLRSLRKLRNKDPVQPITPESCDDSYLEKSSTHGKTEFGLDGYEKFA